MLSHLDFYTNVNYFDGKTWSDVFYAAYLIKKAAECNQKSVSSKVIRRCFPEFKTPKEKVQSYITGIIGTGSKILTNKSFLVGTGVAACLIIVTTMIKKYKHKRTKNAQY